jgi:hypothetical protein
LRLCKVLKMMPTERSGLTAAVYSAINAVTARGGYSSINTTKLPGIHPDAPLLTRRKALSFRKVVTFGYEHNYFGCPAYQGQMRKFAQ